MFKWHISVLLHCIGLYFCGSCEVIELNSDHLGLESLILNRISPHEYPAYRQPRERLAYEGFPVPGNKSIYLYHILTKSWGQWVLNNVLWETNSHQAVRRSSAISPSLTDVVAMTNNYWQVFNGSSWNVDKTLTCVCGKESTPSVVFFTANNIGWSLSGFYVLSTFLKDIYPVYVHIKAETDVQVYLYRALNKWIIGESPGSREALAYVTDDASDVSNITRTTWYFVTQDMWKSSNAYIFTGNQNLNIYDKIRQHRDIMYGKEARHPIPKLFGLLTVPKVGLAIDGITSKNIKISAADIISKGYHMFQIPHEDLDYYSKTQLSVSSLSFSIPPKRAFIVSEVTNAFYGTYATAYHVLKSLAYIQSSYIDLVLLQAPKCTRLTPQIHCIVAIEDFLRFEESWSVLERMYAEGRVMAIGLSGVDDAVLEMLTTAFATIMTPHVVQVAGSFSFSSIADIHKRCHDIGALLMIYRTLGATPNFSPDRYQIYYQASLRYGVSISTIVSKIYAMHFESTIMIKSINSKLVEEHANLSNWNLSDVDLIELRNLL